MRTLGDSTIVWTVKKISKHRIVLEGNTLRILTLFKHLDNVACHHLLYGIRCSPAISYFLKIHVCGTSKEGYMYIDFALCEDA